MDYAILIAAGVLAGFMNAVAGAGSLLTLPALIFTGLDANSANATNRIAVLVQNAASLGVYRKKEIGGVEAGLRLCVPATLASIAGAAVATLLTDLMMRVTIALCMVAFVPLTFHLKRRIRAKKDSPEASPTEVSARDMLAFAAIGFFGGFVQAGVGILVLLVLAIGRGTNLVVANHIKTMVVFVLTLGAMAVFLIAGTRIDLPRGLILGAATMVGSLLGTHESVRRGERFISAVMMVIVLGGAARLLWQAWEIAQG